jgi:hypothetical protein
VREIQLQEKDIGRSLLTKSKTSPRDVGYEDLLPFRKGGHAPTAQEDVMPNKDNHNRSTLGVGMNEKTAEFLAEKQQEQNNKSAQHQYPVEDKRKEARREHTNGSTPRSDQ